MKILYYLPKKLSDRRGQSLLEMMIALTMLTVVFLGISALLERSFFLNRVATDETIGSYLAAEGIEITKNIIDHDMYGSAHVGWGVDVVNGTFSPVFTDVSFLSVPPDRRTEFLDFDSSTPQNGYNYNSPSKKTPFKRWVVITTPTSTEFDVVSNVSWSTGPLTTETITDEDQFYDWYPKN